MLIDVLELKVKCKNYSLDKTDYVMWSQDLRKISVNWPRQIFKIKEQKNTKNTTLSTIFGGFRGLNDPCYQFSEATFLKSILP